MTASQAKFALETMHNESIHSSHTETMSGIEPLPTSSTPSPNYSPNPNAPLVPYSPRTDFKMTKRFADGAKFDLDLFSPVGDVKNNPDVVADNAATAGAYGKTFGASVSETDPQRRDHVVSSEPNTLRKEWSAMQRHGGYSESKLHHQQYSAQRNRETSDHSTVSTTSAHSVTNRQLFVRKNLHEVLSSKIHANETDTHLSKNQSVSNRSGSDRQAFITGTSGLGDSQSSSKLGTGVKDVSREAAQGATYRYNVQSDRIDIDQQSPDDADNLPPHYLDGSFSEPLASGRSGAPQRTAPEGVGGHPSGFLSLSSQQQQQQPAASSPKRSPFERAHPSVFQRSRDLPPEFAEIEHLRQNLSNLISSPGAESPARNESLSDLLLHGTHDGERPLRQSVDSTKTDSLIGAQAFHGISPSPEKRENDSGLASQLTSGQRSGVSVADGSLKVENRMLRDSLERERCRRKHCESQISSLQGRILETQQLLAVAQATERKKDNMIAQLDKTMGKVSASLKQREQEKGAALDQLKTANDALQAEIGQQRTIISDLKEELGQARHQYEQAKKAEKTCRDQLKQHHTDSNTRWEEAQQLAKLSNKQIESLGEDCVKAERQLTQVQDILAQEREAWRRKEVELEERATRLEMDHARRQDEMTIALQEEKRSLEEVRKELVEARREAEGIREYRDKAVREKEKASLEMSLQEGRWEARLRSREAELSGEHEARLRAQAERLEGDAAETEVAMRDEQRRQVAEMGERHRGELRVQKDAHQRDTTQREKRWAETQHQYQTRLAQCQQEIIKLTTKLEKVHHQRFSMVGKLQSFLQTQCNDAVMMVSSMEASPQTPLTHDPRRSEVKGHSGALSRLQGGSYAAKSDQLEDYHAEVLLEAQEQARQAIRRLQLPAQGDQGDLETAPHEAALPFQPLEPSPASPSCSNSTLDTSQASSYHGINASSFHDLHSQSLMQPRAQPHTQPMAHPLPQPRAQPQAIALHDISTSSFQTLHPQSMTQPRAQPQTQGRVQPKAIASHDISTASFQPLPGRIQSQPTSELKPLPYSHPRTHSQQTVLTNAYSTASHDTSASSFKSIPARVPSQPTTQLKAHPQTHSQPNSYSKPIQRETHPGTDGSVVRRDNLSTQYSRTTSRSHAMNRSIQSHHGDLSVSRGNVSHAGSGVRLVGLDAERSNDLVEHDGNGFVALTGEEASVCRAEEEEEEEEESWSQQDSHVEGEDDFVGWMSQHESTLTSSPTKQTPSPDVNIHAGLGMLLQVPPTGLPVANPALGTHGMEQSHIEHELSMGPLSMLDSPTSSQENWKEIALQKYVAKLLEQSPSSTDDQKQAVPLHAPRPSHTQRALQTRQDRGIVQKETLHPGPAHTTHPPSGVSRVAAPVRGSSAGTQNQPVGHGPSAGSHHQPVGQGRGTGSSAVRSARQVPGVQSSAGRPTMQKDIVQKPAASQQQAKGRGGPRDPQQTSSRPRDPQQAANRPRSDMGPRDSQQAASKSRPAAGAVKERQAGGAGRGGKTIQKSGVWR